MEAGLFSAASDRNKQAILDQLIKLFSGLLPGNLRVLEIGSGWAQHAMYFTGKMNGLSWQPSERPEALAELRACLELNGNTSIKPPIALDVLTGPWPENHFEVVYSANTAHIMSWPAVLSMFSGIGSCLIAGGLFCLYGPFNVDGLFTAPSNQSFDQHLRTGDPEMGIRDLEALESLACSHQMILRERIQMPANNFLLVFEKLNTTDVKEESMS